MFKLYKIDSKGRVRVWGGYTEGAEVVTVTGLVDGKRKEDRSTSKAKNVGRSNETTPEEQALLEVEAKYNKKKDEGYFNSIEEAKSTEVILPMLAQSYDKHSKKIVWEGLSFVQPKLDGMRALVIVKDGLAKVISRKGKEIDTMNHIVEACSFGPDRIMDGELYCHGETFQSQMRMIKKYREGESEKVQFHCYDMVSNLSFIDRHHMVGNYASSDPEYVIQPVDTFQITSEEQLKELYGKFMDQGYEGAMVRHSNAGYEMDKRSYSLLKYKKFIDEVYEVVDIIPSDKRPEHGVVVCAIPYASAGGNPVENPPTFRANPKMSHDERAELLENKDEYIGQMAEIRFFEFSEDGVPRFPIFLGVRLDC